METGIEGNLPAWQGASECYSKAYKILANMAQNGHVKRHWIPYSKDHRYVNQYCCYPSTDMTDLIDALNSGNEEKIKGMLLTDYYLKYLDN
jgi:hypothetical protein